MLSKLSTRARVQALAISNFGIEGARRYMRVLDASIERQKGRRQHLMLEAEGMFPRVAGVGFEHDAYVKS